MFVNLISSGAKCHMSTFFLERDVQYASIISSPGAEKLLKMFDPRCKASTGFGALKINNI